MWKLSGTGSRELDIICLGRGGVDICAEQWNKPFSEVHSFTKQIGGSSANIAVGCARLGMRVGFISRLSADPVGVYVRDFLTSEGIDTRYTVFDDTGTRTSLAIAEIKPYDCLVLIYRNNAADLALSAGDVDEAYVASSRLLLLTGTALSVSPSRDATMRAIEYARQNDTCVVLDLDYRPYSWKSPEETARVLGAAAARCDVIVGNREEFNVLEGRALNDDGDDALTANKFHNEFCDLIIVKHGEQGANSFPRDEAPMSTGIFPVEAIKPFGAGDGFASALCSALLEGRMLGDCVMRASASAAIVVSQIGCAEAMPFPDELDAFIAASDFELQKGKHHA